MATKQSDLMSFPIRMSSDVERLFKDMIQRPWEFCRDARGWNPSMDLYEDGDCFYLEADLPGVKREDISVEVVEGDLVVRGYRAIVHTHTAGCLRAMERSSGHFLRRMALPQSVDPARIEADFCDGVLRVTIPKLQKPEGKEE